MVAPDNSQLYSDLSLGFLLPSLGSFSNSCGGWRRHGMEGGQGRGEGKGEARRGGGEEGGERNVSVLTAQHLLHLQL